MRYTTITTKTVSSLARGRGLVSLAQKCSLQRNALSTLPSPPRACLFHTTKNNSSSNQSDLSRIATKIATASATAAEQRIRSHPEYYNVDHHKWVYRAGMERIFVNPWSTFSQPQFKEVLKWNLNRKETMKPVPSQEELDQHLPVLEPNWHLINNNNNEDIKVTWIGHVTFLVQMNGLNFLTDPVFSERASIVQWAGPKRIRRVPCTVAQLPGIDFVLLSHNHYDHLDFHSVMQLRALHDPVFYVPLGLKPWFFEKGITKVYELDWWQSIDHHHASTASTTATATMQQTENATTATTATISFVPAQHWSFRNPFKPHGKRFASLWGGFLVHDHALKKTVYFCGDTGYCSAFKQIGAFAKSLSSSSSSTATTTTTTTTTDGGIDVGLIPIGAYEPRWFMKSQHVNVEEAVQISLDVEAKVSIGMHWGTFVLTDEHVLEPKRMLHEELQKRNLPPEHFITMAHGETKLF